MCRVSKFKILTGDQQSDEIDSITGNEGSALSILTKKIPMLDYQIKKTKSNFQSYFTSTVQVCTIG